MLVFALAAACSAGDGVDSGDFSGDATAPRHPDAAFTADQVAEQLKERVKFGAPSSPALIDTFGGMLQHGDDACPGPQYREQALEYYPPAGCTAESGYWYQGVGGAGFGWKDDDADGMFDMYIEAMKVDGSMGDPEGNRFTFGGATEFTLSGDPLGGGTFEGAFLGSYAYPAAAAGWLAEGVSTGYYVEGTIDSEGIWSFEANGGFAVAGVAVSLSALTINGACGTMPTGRVGVRDDDGYWYDLVYDESTCDGCGEVWFDGRESLGTACADITPGMMSLALEIGANMQEALERI